MPDRGPADPSVGRAPAAPGAAVKQAISFATRGYFADPDGFLREVCFNPFFPPDENGSVRLPE